MKQLSAAQLKAHVAPSQRVPKPGTQLRATYDYFMRHKGMPVEYDGGGANNIRLGQLRDFYGLDIRRIRKRTYCLCGEHLSNGVYIDYVAERLGL